MVELDIVQTFREICENIAKLQEMRDGQSAALREVAKVLAENGIDISRFTRPTQEVLVAVALNGTY